MVALSRFSVLHTSPCRSSCKRLADQILATPGTLPNAFEIGTTLSVKTPKPPNSIRIRQADNQYGPRSRHADIDDRRRQKAPEAPYDHRQDAACHGACGYSACILHSSRHISMTISPPLKSSSAACQVLFDIHALVGDFGIGFGALPDWACSCDKGAHAFLLPTVNGVFIQQPCRANSPLDSTHLLSSFLSIVCMGLVLTRVAAAGNLSA